MIARWKGIFEDYALCHQNLTLSTAWLWWAKKKLFGAPKRPWKYSEMCWHENIQNKSVGLGWRPPISTWNMWRAEDSPRNVEPTITKKYRRTCWTKNWQNELVGIGGWQPISTYINRSHLGSNGIDYVECPGKRAKHVLNLNFVELCALLEKLRCLITEDYHKPFVGGVEYAPPICCL